MKLSSILIILGSVVIITTFSCSKQYDHYKSPTSALIRTVQFVLYTDTTFTNENSLITFTLSIVNSSNKTLWDSVLSPMKLKDIPDLQHNIMVRKTVPNDDNSLLKVGFYYTIENIGSAWKFDAFTNREIFKLVEFNFR